MKKNTLKKVMMSCVIASTLAFALTVIQPNVPDHLPGEHSVYRI